MNKDNDILMKVLELVKMVEREKINIGNNTKINLSFVFKEIDIEKDEDGEVLAEKYQVRSVPTTVLVDEDGEPIYKVMGNIPEKDFITIINESLKDM